MVKRYIYTPHLIWRLFQSSFSLCELAVLIWEQHTNLNSSMIPTRKTKERKRNRNFTRIITISYTFQQIKKEWLDGWSDAYKGKNALTLYFERKQKDLRYRKNCLKRKFANQNKYWSTSNSWNASFIIVTY